MAEVLPKPLHASKNAGGSSRREKVFHARGKRRTNGVDPTGGATSSSSTNSRPKGKKINDGDEQIEERGDNDQEDDEGKNERREDEDVEGCDNTDDNGEAPAVVSDDTIGCKKQRASEDAYMLIYVREGVDWGIGGEEKGDVALPEHVLVSQGV